MKDDERIVKKGEIRQLRNQVKMRDCSKKREQI